MLEILKATPLLYQSPLLKVVDDKLCIKITLVRCDLLLRSRISTELCFGFVFLIYFFICFIMLVVNRLQVDIFFG